ncbi:MAG: DUF4339 domain-containing protein [Bacteroidota bacterium]|nr:DUF4339 domain-containing protein [Bacteroidota bacterium]
MIVYYYEENGKQLGPFTLEEMKSKRIKKTTLVWKDGLQNWVKAEELVEFKAVVVSVPPPLPNNNQLDIKNTFIKIKNNQLEKLKTINKSSKEKFDRTYKKQIGAPIFAILSMIFIGVFIWINDREGLIILKELIILSRLIGIIIVINIAENQNRNSTIWGILSVFFTYASLIIIGLLPKLKLEEDIYDNKVPARVEYLAIGVILLLLTLSIGWLVRDFFSNYSFCCSNALTCTYN